MAGTQLGKGYLAPPLDAGADPQKSDHLNVSHSNSRRTPFSMMGSGHAGVLRSVKHFLVAYHLIELEISLRMHATIATM